MADGGMAEPALGQRIEPMGVAAGVERVAHQLGVVVVAQGDAVLREHHGVELDVEADLQDARPIPAAAAALPARRRSRSGPAPARHRTARRRRRIACGRAGRSRRRWAQAPARCPHISACIGSIEFALASSAKWPTSCTRAIQALSWSRLRIVYVFAAIDPRLARLPPRARRQAHAASARHWIFPACSGLSLRQAGSLCRWRARPERPHVRTGRLPPHAGAAEASRPICR